MAGLEAKWNINDEGVVRRDRAFWKYYARYSFFWCKNLFMDVWTSWRIAGNYRDIIPNLGSHNLFQQAQLNTIIQ